MRGLFQGGQCNPTAMGATSNQYKRMMNTLSMGNANNQRLMFQAQHGQNFQGQIAERQAMFMKMNQAWGTSQKQMMEMQRQMQMMMNTDFDKGRQQYEMDIIKMQEMGWMNAQEEMAARNAMMNQQFENAKIMEEAQRWKNQFLMNKQFDAATISKQEEQKNIMNSSNHLFELMMNDSDPRFQNSQFLNFLKRIQNKQLIIEGKQIREVGPTEKTMEKAWQQGQQQYEKNQQTMKQKLQEAEKLKAQQSIKMGLNLEQHWAKKLQQYQKEYSDRDGYEKMLQQKYMQVLKEMNLDMTEAWKSAADLQQQIVHGDIKQNYAFAQDNPFSQQKDKKALALEFINRGLNNQATLALEAYIQQQTEDSEGWRILGRVLQENDQDLKSITCFVNSLKYNPQNLDSLLSLGISCTNILDEIKAMNYLKKWIICNPKYKHVNVDPNVIPDNQVDFYTYRIEDIKTANERMIGIFQNALLTSPNDPQLFNSLAILYFIKRDYDRAIDLFQRALQLDPDNYLLMNKIGAALAHLGQADQAIKFYHMALNIRPNYVRVWVNLGIAHGFKGNYQEAARFYLNALSFRPDSKHIWSYLHTTFMSMQRYDLIQLISQQNPKLFTEFDIIALKDLPQPEIDYKITTQKHILNKDSIQWLQEYKKLQ